MKLLVDTHLLLWAARGTKRVPPKAREFVCDTTHDLLFSVVSLWEITIKRSLGRADFQFDPRLLRSNLLGNGYSELTISSAHVLAVETLPAIHKDPFDRLLLAQAMTEGVTLLTADATVARYPCPVLRV